MDNKLMPFTWVTVRPGRSTPADLVQSRFTQIGPRSVSELESVLTLNSTVVCISIRCVGGLGECPVCHCSFFLSARCNIYISRLCYDASVYLSVTEVHWRITANLISNSDPHLLRIVVAVHAANRGGVISRYASHC